MIHWLSWRRSTWNSLELLAISYLHLFIDWAASTKRTSSNNIWVWWMLFDHLSTSWSLLHHGWSMFKSINRRTIIKSTLIINNLSVIESLIKLGLLLYSSRLKPVNLMVNLLKWALYRLMSILYELRMWVLHPGTSWLNLHHSFMSLRGLGWLLLNYLRWWTLIIYILILIVMKIWILNHMLWLRLSMHYWLCL